MGSKAIAVGAVGRVVARNVGYLREERGLSYRDLAQCMTEAGRPISHTSVYRLESGDYRVDVDDLVTLALVLRVSVTALIAAPREEEIRRG